jgi:DNA-binding winged helix-turn-helix (wHTH) protein
MSHHPNHLYEFGPFRLDIAERMLLRDGEAIPLQPKAFDLLRVLVEHHGHLLEKDELLKVVWPGAIVEEVNLANNISVLRKALGEDGNGQRFIETVPRRGYRFVAGVRQIQHATIEEELLQPAIPYEAASFSSFRPNWIRGRAYLQLKQGAAAAAEFQKIIDHRGWDAPSPLWPLAHLGLARAAALQGDAARSRKAYEDFFAVWKEADADLSVLREAKREYEKR